MALTATATHKVSGREGGGGAAGRVPAAWQAFWTALSSGGGRRRWQQQQQRHRQQRQRSGDGGSSSSSSGGTSSREADRLDVPPPPPPPPHPPTHPKKRVKAIESNSPQNCFRRNLFFRVVQLRLRLLPHCTRRHEGCSPTWRWAGLLQCSAAAKPVPCSDQRPASVVVPALPLQKDMARREDSGLPGYMEDMLLYIQ